MCGRENSVVEIRKMSFSYGRRMLFSDLDLALQDGNIYGLLGKNGAGKTTLLKIISGLRHAQEGWCRVFGHDPIRRSAALLEKIFFIPEELYLPAFSPGVFVQLNAPLYPLFDHQAFRSFLQEFELSTGGKLPELSYGQKKKFLIAFGLASRCRLLLLDEPTNGLDIPSKSQFRRLIARACGPEQLILISTHQVRDMENLIDPILILDDGRIIFQRSLQEVGVRVRTSVESSEPVDGETLWAERTLGGWAVLRKNTENTESNVDIEILFNAVISEGGRVRAIFEEASK
jgi:ABC-2 type transport system ATP-binding protein